MAKKIQKKTSKSRRSKSKLKWILTFVGIAVFSLYVTAPFSWNPFYKPHKLGILQAYAPTNLKVGGISKAPGSKSADFNAMPVRVYSYDDVAGGQQIFVGSQYDDNGTTANVTTVSCDPAAADRVYLGLDDGNNSLVVCKQDPQIFKGDATNALLSTCGMLTQTQSDSRVGGGCGSEPNVMDVNNQVKYAMCGGARGGITFILNNNKSVSVACPDNKTCGVDPSTNVTYCDYFWKQATSAKCDPNVSGRYIVTFNDGSTEEDYCQTSQGYQCVSQQGSFDKCDLTPATGQG